MSLVDDLKAWYDEESYPPEGNEDCFNGEAEQVAYKRGDSLRWGTQVNIVYKRGQELVCVSDVEPATEMQDWGDYGEPDIYPVIEYTRTVTDYKKI